jgi:hypothetical protein
VREDFVFRRVRRNGKTVMPLRTRAVAGGGREELPGMREAAINDAVQRACVGAPGREKGPIYSAHSLHCMLPTYASQRGASDRRWPTGPTTAPAPLNQYIRIESGWADNAATALDL